MTKIVARMKEDPIVQQALSKMPESVADSFNEEQLFQLRNLMATRHWRKHKIDLRGSFRSLRYRYYYVIVVGRDRRSGTREARSLGQFLSIGLLSLLLICAALTILGLVYVLKSALGVDLFKNFSIGVW